MEAFVEAEFDSVDLADLAAGKIRSIPGVSGTNVICNRFKQGDGGKKATVPVIPFAGGWSSTGGMVAGQFYAGYELSGSGEEYGKEFEPGQKREAVLKVGVNSQKAAQMVAGALRNAGGRKVSSHGALPKK